MTRSNFILEANKLFKKQEYVRALSLYRKAAKEYGDELVRFNIEMCLKKSGLTKEVELDPITMLLLNNDNKLKLNKEVRSEFLSFYESLCGKKSQKIHDVKKVNPVPNDWPDDLILAPLPEGPNDFDWYLKFRYQPKKECLDEPVGLSIIIPTFNRHRILDITLACLTHQITNHNFEVIVADDGSSENLTDIVRKYENKLDIKFVRQRDYGYQLCAVRNLGMRTASYNFVSILDCDMAPGPHWVQSYVDGLIECDDIALIGPRKYVDTHDVDAKEVLGNSSLIENLPEVRTNSDVGNSKKGDISVDWRLEHFRKTEDLRLCDSPFRYFSGGNVAFSKKWLHKIGWFDEEFTHWGGEDNEFGYRLFRAGCFFKVVHGGMAYHQEPPGRENETDRAAGKAITIKIVQEKVPYFYRKLAPISESKIHRVPLVSIYIPAYNCEKTIIKCVESALQQTVTDLEVCICDDGSTDNTLLLLKENFNNHPRVRFVSQVNGGIGKASNAAVNLCRGFYIGQLDSDDYLEPDAVELCLKEFFKNRHLACVYTANRNVDADGELIEVGYNWPVYSREKLTSAMICHHFRMFTARAWSLTSGFDEKITNAVDYDMYLKLSEVGPFKHLNVIAYNRVLHGENTSIKKLGIQKVNHFKVVNDSLARQKVDNYNYSPQDMKNDACRKYYFNQKN